MIVLFVLIHLLIIFYEWHRHSMGLILWAVLFAIFTVPHLAHYYAEDYAYGTLSSATAFAVVFMTLYFFVRFAYGCIRKEKIITIIPDDLKNSSDALRNFFFWVYLTSFVIAMGYFYWHGNSLLTVHWTYEGYHSSIEHLANFIIVSFSGLGFIFFITKKYIKFLTLFSIYIINILITQSRYMVIGFIAPFMIYFLFSPYRRKKTQGILLGLCIILGVFLLQQYRWLGGLSNALHVGFSAIAQNTIEYMKNGNGEFGLVKAFYYFIENNNNFKSFGEGLGYIRLSMVLLPASLVAFKPRDFAIDMYREWFHRDDPAGTMHPTLYGDVFANFGILGCIMGAFYGLFVSFVDEVLFNTREPSVKILRISLTCTMMVLLARGAVYNSIANWVFGCILTAIIELAYRVLTKWRRRKVENPLR